MKKPLFPIIIICIFITFLSCSNKSKRSRKPVSRISIMPAKKNYTFNNAIEIEVKTRVKNGEIHNIKLYYGNELLTTNSNLDFTYKLKNITKLGTNTLKAVATKTDGVSNYRIKNFYVLSDIQPVEKKMRVIKEYPHSTTFFTEGLLLHNGYLYEGTGQNGMSGIYKINLNNGKTILSKELDKKYFGEGITILNDKIYQLTYHSKIGFVYNLSDFSIIDSFKIASNQGWGLTNDGENLIMSDGTNKLTWISPSNYAIIKTLQVADNLSKIDYINELEYINGSVFANVWTKNYIIEIDAENGKVLSKADLSGLLTKLNVDKSKIDVMNGIAYNPVSNTFFVTGKMWDKIFEIELE
ncbi:MAG: glutaminyl-peptide cyclotransferase [Chlorobi bacterium]|nr:glutaminyl-peptide cyclotransferase [Chlorobiota bacterium]